MDDTDNYLFMFFRKITSPLVNIFYKLGITANQVTVMGALLMLSAYILLLAGLKGYWGIAIFIIFLTGFLLDWVDGVLARKRNEQTDYGVLFDMSVDYWRNILTYFVAVFLSYINTNDIWVFVLYVLGVGMWEMNNKTDEIRRRMALKYQTQASLKNVFNNQSILSVCMKTYNSFDRFGHTLFLMVLMCMGMFQYIKFVFLYLIISKFFRNIISYIKTYQIIKNG